MVYFAFVINFLMLLNPIFAIKILTFFSLSHLYSHATILARHFFFFFFLYKVPLSDSNFHRPINLALQLLFELFNKYYSIIRTSDFLLHFLPPIVASFISSITSIITTLYKLKRSGDITHPGTNPSFMF